MLNFIFYVLRLEHLRTWELLAAFVLKYSSTADINLVKEFVKLCLTSIIASTSELGIDISRRVEILIKFLLVLLGHPEPALCSIYQRILKQDLGSELQSFCTEMSRHTVVANKLLQNLLNINPYYERSAQGRNAVCRGYGKNCPTGTC